MFILTAILFLATMMAVLEIVYIVRGGRGVLSGPCTTHKWEYDSAGNLFCGVCKKTFKDILQ